MNNVRSEDPKSEIQDPASKRRWSTWILRAFAVGTVLYLIILHVVPRAFELPHALSLAPTPGLEVTDRQGVPLRRFLSDEQRIDRGVDLSEVPRALIDATLAAEDSRFYRHNGIDYAGVLRAARDAVANRRFVSGASTVSQQLIKLSSVPRARDLRTKLIEAFTARRLEQDWDKDRILAAYLNRLPYGNQLVGCRAAARGYFAKPLADLSLAECAFLAGLPNKPTRLNPHRNFDGARQRQQHVLARMLEEGLISEADHRAALAEPIRLIDRQRSPFRAPHLVDLAIGAGPPDVSGNLRQLRTTIDATLQDFAEQAIAGQLRRLEQQLGEVSTLQAAAVVIDNASGDVLALAGSRDFFGSPGGQINGAWTPRSPGSALKPFTYLVALERGHTAASVLSDDPVEYPTATGGYRPVNFDRQFRGPVLLRDALAISLNVPAVRLLDELGGPAILQHALEDVGITTLGDDPAVHGLGLTLGGAEVRLLELTNAYACLARLGRYLPYRLHRFDREGDHAVQVFDPGAAWILADILSDNRARAATFGFDSALRFDSDLRVACKTGTSTDSATTGASATRRCSPSACGWVASITSRCSR